jgi:hypothetical protein
LTLFIFRIGERGAGEEDVVEKHGESWTTLAFSMHIWPGTKGDPHERILP